MFGIDILCHYYNCSEGLENLLTELLEELGSLLVELVGASKLDTTPCSHAEGLRCLIKEVRCEFDAAVHGEIAKCSQSMHLDAPIEAAGAQQL